MAAPDRRYVARRRDRTSALAWTGVAVLAVILLVAVGVLVWTMLIAAALVAAGMARAARRG